MQTSSSSSSCNSSICSSIVVAVVVRVEAEDLRLQLRVGFSCISPTRCNSCLVAIAVKAFTLSRCITIFTFTFAFASYSPFAAFKDDHCAAALNLERKVKDKVLLQNTITK